MRLLGTRGTAASGGIRRDRVAVVKRSMALSESRRGANCGLDIAMGAGDGGFELHALGQPGRYGGSQRAAGAVGMSGLDSLGLEQGLTLLRQQEIDDLAGLVLPARDQNRRRAEFP